VSRLVYALLPLVGGAMIAAQAPVNAKLRLVLGSQFGSAVVSFGVGLVLLMAGLVVVGQVDSLAAVGTGPWWAYLGGLFGAVFVVATLVAAPRVGVTTTFVAAVAGQILLSAMIDRFGWFGARTIDLSWERIVALLLLAVSLVLLLRSS
jgi:transporter family-2 protein